MNKLLPFCLILLSLTSCGRAINNWTEQDCTYADYYQSRPLNQGDKNYYHSDPIQPQ